MNTIINSLVEHFNFNEVRILLIDKKNYRF